MKSLPFPLFVSVLRWVVGWRLWVAHKVRRQRDDEDEGELDWQIGMKCVVCVSPGTDKEIRLEGSESTSTL